MYNLRTLQCVFHKYYPFLSHSALDTVRPQRMTREKQKNQFFFRLRMERGKATILLTART